jgi:hypothetical protein
MPAAALCGPRYQLGGGGVVHAGPLVAVWASVSQPSTPSCSCPPPVEPDEMPSLYKSKITNVRAAPEGVRGWYRGLEDIE